TVRLRDGELGPVGGRDAPRGGHLGPVARARRVAGGDALGRGAGPGGLQRARHRPVARRAAAPCRAGPGTAGPGAAELDGRGGAVAAIYSMNARYVRRSLTAVSARPVAARGANRLQPPRSPRLAIAWRDAVAPLSVPQRLGEALVLAAGGTVVSVVNGERPVA